MNSHFDRSDVKILQQQIVYQGHFQIKQLKVQFRLYNGEWSQPRLREVFERGDAVGILLFDVHNDQLVLIEQFRVGALGEKMSPWVNRNSSRCH